LLNHVPPLPVAQQLPICFARPLAPQHQHAASPQAAPSLQAWSCLASNQFISHNLPTSSDNQSPGGWTLAALPLPSPACPAITACECTERPTQATTFLLTCVSSWCSVPSHRSQTTSLHVRHTFTTQTKQALKPSSIM
jgi:hypothetical protein